MVVELKNLESDRNSGEYQTLSMFIHVKEKEHNNVQSKELKFSTSNKCQQYFIITINEQARICVLPFPC